MCTNDCMVKRGTYSSSECIPCKISNSVVDYN